VVEVIAPDGRKSLWIAVVEMAKAVEAVKQVIPPNYVATLTKQRLTITRKRRSAEDRAMTHCHGAATGRAVRPRKGQ